MEGNTSAVVSVVAKSTPVAPTQEHSYDEIHPIAGLLGLDTKALTTSDTANLKAVYDFVRADAPEMTELELLHKVRQLENKLGFTSLGERRIDRVFRYVKLQSQISNLEKVRDREFK